MAIVLEGIHSTCRSHLIEILKSRGIRSDPGTVGTGAYFWKKTPFGNDLARCWYEYRKAGYQKEVDPSYATLEAEITVEEENFLNLDDPELADEMESYYMEKKHILGAKTSVNRAAMFYDLFIEEIEREAKAEIWVVEKRVSPPNWNGGYPKDIFPNPRAYIVRNDKAVTRLLPG